MSQYTVVSEDWIIILERLRKSLKIKFPSWAASLIIIPGLILFFTTAKEPFWITYRAVGLFLIFGYALANIVGLFVVRLSRSSSKKR